MTTSGGSEPAARRTAELQAALARGDVAKAAAVAEQAVAAGQEEPLILNLTAWAREEAGDYAGAHRLLRRALVLSPGDPLVLGSVGALLRKEGRLGDALAVLERVIAAAPQHAGAWLERGYTLDDMREGARAEESYRRAIAIDPDLAPAHGKLADAAARRGDAAGARAHADSALRRDPREPAAIAALATVAIEARDGAAAEALVRPLLAASLKEEDRTRTLTLLGDALDRQDRTAEAFAAWQDAKRSFRARWATALAPGPERPSHRAFIERIAEQVAGTPPPAPRPVAEQVPGAARTHVMLLGYPRSGTTLVENVLASAADVVALEERETFIDVDRALVANDGTMADLDALDDAELARLRAAYWARVTAMAGSVTGRVFVDMNPFNGIKLPVVARLFPDARVVVMRRDPRDVILSCYRINFTPSAAAWAFSDLEEAGRHYHALTGLIELCRERLPLAYHELRYDRLVTAFEPTVRALAEFIGIDWTDDFLRFDRTARTRGVRTASATQVRRGLYDGRGQWRRYAAQLKPVLPILGPWVERFGFEA